MAVTDADCCWLWFCVMMQIMILHGISGNHINPAFTIALASNGLFPWAEVVPYIVANTITEQLLDN